jgi:hypothetical protein
MELLAGKVGVTGERVGKEGGGAAALAPTPFPPISIRASFVMQNLF